MEVRRTVASLVVLLAIFFTGFFSSQPDETTNYKNCIAIKKFAEFLRTDGANHPQQTPPTMKVAPIAARQSGTQYSGG